MRYDVAIGMTGAAIGIVPTQPGNPTWTSDLDWVHIGTDADPKPCYISHIRAIRRCNTCDAN